jgi:hypothetical protein
VTHRARIVLLSVALAAALSASHGLAGADETPVPSGPCADEEEHFRCPDLMLRPPSDLRVLRGRNGRLRLASRNVLVNRGAGPLFLLGKRDEGRTMRVGQRLFAESGFEKDFPLDDTWFDFWAIPGQGSYWKLRDALHFELWTADSDAPEFVKAGRKTRFCMRDLGEVPGLPGPRFRRFPGCNQSPRTQTLVMGISVGWYESYPPGYYEQYVDIDGLRGCFTLRHIADPLGHVYESDETNNMSDTRVRLPPRRGRVRRC